MRTYRELKDGPLPTGTLSVTTTTISMGKIEIYPMDVSDLSAGESASLSTGASSRHQRPKPRKERATANECDNERISRKDRNKRRQARRRRSILNDNSSGDDTEPCLRRAATVDTPINIRRDRSSPSSAPVAPFRRSSTGPLDPSSRRFARSNTETSSAAPQPYGPLAPLAPIVPKRRASIRCSPDMDDTSETVASTDHDDSDGCHHQQVAYVYHPEQKTYQQVPVLGLPSKKKNSNHKRVPRSSRIRSSVTNANESIQAPTASTMPRQRHSDPGLNRRVTLTEGVAVRRTVDSVAPFRRNGSMDSLPCKPRRRDSVATSSANDS